MVVLSPSERSYIKAGCGEGIRQDGRSPREFRQIFVKRGVMARSQGSCRVWFGSRGTDVLCVVTTEIGDQATLAETTRNEEDAEDGMGLGAEVVEKAGKEGVLTMGVVKGKIAINVENAPASGLSSAQTFQKNTLLTKTVQRLFESSSACGVDLESLVIVEGSNAWILKVDILVMDSEGGNLLDAILLAVKGALLDTRIPKTEVVNTEEGQTEFEVVPDPGKATRVKGAENVPVSVTVSKIGGRLVFDSSAYEEECSDVSLHVITSPSGKICMIQKSGQGHLDIQEAKQMIQEAREAGIVLGNDFSRSAA